MNLKIFRINSERELLYYINLNFQTKDFIHFVIPSVAEGSTLNHIFKRKKWSTDSSSLRFPRNDKGNEIWNLLLGINYFKRYYMAPIINLITMKKLITFFVTFCLLIIPISLSQAEDVNETNALQALMNISDLDSYRIIQGINGTILFEDDYTNKSFEVLYRISFNSNVINNNLIDKDQQTRINAYMKATAIEGVHFETATINASVDLILLDGTKLYGKLNDFRVNSTGMDEYDQQKGQEMVDILSPYMDQWYLIPLESIRFQGEEVYSEDTLAMQEAAAEEWIASGNVKDVIVDVVNLELDSQVAEGMITEEDRSEIDQVIDLALDSEFFNQRDIVSGNNEGFKFFNLNKYKIINFIKNFGNVIGEELTESDEEDLREVLSKFSLAGIYRIDETYNILDNLFMRFKMRELDILKSLTVNYRHKINGINQVGRLSAPPEYELLEETIDF